MICTSFQLPIGWDIFMNATLPLPFLFTLHAFLLIERNIVIVQGKGRWHDYVNLHHVYMGIIELLIKLPVVWVLWYVLIISYRQGNLMLSKVHLTLYLLQLIRPFFYEDMSYNQHTKSILSYTIPIKFDVIGKNG